MFSVNTHIVFNYAPGHLQEPIEQQAFMQIEKAYPGIGRWMDTHLYGLWRIEAMPVDVGLAPDSDYAAYAAYLEFELKTDADRWKERWGA